MRLIRLVINSLVVLVLVTSLQAVSKIDNNTPAVKQLNVAAPLIIPFVYVDDKNHVKGVLVEKLRRFEQASGVKVNIFVMPWARAINEIKTNRIDAIMPILYRETRTSFIEYPTEPIIRFNGSVIIKRITDPFVFTQIDDIGKNKIIGKTRSVLVGHDFEKAVLNGDVTVYETLNLSTSLSMLIQGKLDLVVSDVDIAKSTVERLGLNDDFTFIPLSGAGEVSFLAFSKAFAQVNDINALIENINQINYKASSHP